MPQLKKLSVFILFCLLVQCSSQADYGKVTVVYDGDTIQVQLTTGEKEKIRLIGVDAPETGADDKNTRLKALFSKRFAFKFLYKKQVKIEYDWEKRDKYGRLLAYIWTEDGTFFNEFIIRKGFAKAYIRFKYKTEFKERFLQAEEHAKKRGNGIWKKEPFPLILSRETSKYMGQLVSYEFVCEKIEDKGNLLLLVSKKDDFGVPVYKKYLHFFPEIQTWVGKRLIISGLLEEYKSQPQIMLFLPSQLNTV
ncbi:MAG: thermonuclease family protein [Candidatus Aminicenantes bacterium]